MADNKALLTVSEVAEVFRVSYRTVYFWIQNGKLKALRLPSGTYRIEQSEVDRIKEEARNWQEVRK